jgi:hypothetical protein
VRVVSQRVTKVLQTNGRLEDEPAEHTAPNRHGDDSHARVQGSSQTTPASPGKHAHRNRPIVLAHVPSFMQGDEMHSPHVPHTGLRAVVHKCVETSKLLGLDAMRVTHHRLMSWLNEYAYANMLSMLVTLDTSHPPMGWLKNDALNMLCMFVVPVRSGVSTALITMFDTP